MAKQSLEARGMAPMLMLAWMLTLVLASPVRAKAAAAMG
jgi:hypothetical protein